jgi:hypothetical protein
MQLNASGCSYEHGKFKADKIETQFGFKDYLCIGALMILHSFLLYFLTCIGGKK